METQNCRGYKRQTRKREVKNRFWQLFYFGVCLAEMETLLKPKVHLAFVLQIAIFKVKSIYLIAGWSAHLIV
jgi:hypothetical protein